MSELAILYVDDKLLFQIVCKNNQDESHASDLAKAAN